MPGFVPTPTDRADYYPDPYGARELTWGLNGSAAGANTELLLQDVSDWATLLFSSPGGGGAANFAAYTFTWYADPQGTQAITTDTVVVPPTLPVDVALAVKGPYVQCVSTSITGAGTHTTGGRFRVASYPSHAYSLPTLLLSLNGVSVGAAATRTDNIPRVVTGSAYLGASMPGSAGNLQVTVTATDPTNTTVVLGVLHGVTGDPAKSINLWLPPWPVQVATNNADAAAHGVTLGFALGR